MQPEEDILDNRERIRRSSRRLRWVITVALVLVLAYPIMFWGGFNWLMTMVDLGVSPVEIHLPVPVSGLLLGLLASTGPVLAVAWGLTNLRRLLVEYECGRIFQPAAVACIRRIGQACLAWVAARLLFDPLSSVAVTLHHPEGQRNLAISNEAIDVSALLLGCVVLLIARVMQEGQRLQEENAQIV